MKIQFVPHSKHTVIKTIQLMLYREIAVFSETQTKHTNTLLAERRIGEC